MSLFANDESDIKFRKTPLVSTMTQSPGGLDSSAIDILFK